MFYYRNKLKSRRSIFLLFENSWENIYKMIQSILQVSKMLHLTLFDFQIYLSVSLLLNRQQSIQGQHFQSASNSLSIVSISAGVILFLFPALTTSVYNTSLTTFSANLLVYVLLFLTKLNSSEKTLRQFLHLNCRRLTNRKTS